MSETIDMTPLATITPVNGMGMVLIRARLDRSGAAVAAGAGLALPAQGRWTAAGARWLGWMSPDELLLMLPHAEVPEAAAALSGALEGHHALVLDVSDMRCVYDITGRKPGQVIAKLCPVDLRALPADGVRRTRAAQIACALWRQGTGYRIVAFRAVADYLRDILTLAAAPGSDLDPR